LPFLLQITDFLNKFDASVRYKLSTIGERLGTLEKTVASCEATLRANNNSGDDGDEEEDNTPRDGNKA